MLGWKDALLTEIGRATIGFTSRKTARSIYRLIRFATGFWVSFASSSAFDVVFAEASSEANDVSGFHADALKILKPAKADSTNS